MVEKLIIYSGAGMACLQHNSNFYNRIKLLQQSLGLDRCIIYSQNPYERLSDIGCVVTNLYVTRYVCNYCGEEGYTKIICNTHNDVNKFHEFQKRIYNTLKEDIEALKNNDTLIMLGILDEDTIKTYKTQCKIIDIEPITNKKELDAFLETFGI